MSTHNDKYDKCKAHSFLVNTNSDKIDRDVKEDIAKCISKSYIPIGKPACHQIYPSGFICYQMICKPNENYIKK